MPYLFNLFKSFLFGVFLTTLSTVVHAQEDRFWVEAVGMAPMQKSQSLARRHAIAEALLSASLSGGASMQGYSVLDKTRIVADRFMMRPTGTIIRYEMISEGQTGRYWQVKLKALVGPTIETYCDENRSLTVAMFPPSLYVSPYAPAWSQQLLANMVNKVSGQVDKHPRIMVDARSNRAEQDLVTPQRAGFDYSALTQGTIQMSAADHGVQIAGKAEMLKDASGSHLLEISIVLSRTQGGRTVESNTVSSRVLLKRAMMTERLNGSKRKQAEAQVSQEISRAAAKVLDTWTCRPPVARLVVNGSDIQVPLGSRHGLSQTSLAFLAEGSASLDVFEIVSLGRKSSKLRAISPSANLSSFNNKEVRFLRTEF